MHMGWVRIESITRQNVCLEKKYTQNSAEKELIFIKSPIHSKDIWKKAYVKQLIVILQHTTMINFSTEKEIIYFGVQTRIT